MRHLLFLVSFCIILSTSFAQVSLLGDAYMKVNGDHGFQGWGLKTKIFVNEDLSIKGVLRGSRERTETNLPGDCAQIGISYRINPFATIDITGGTLTRRGTDGNLRYSIGGEIFLGKVDTRNYYLRKQFFLYAGIEKNEASKDPYVDARLIYPIANTIAIGARYETDLGVGPHLEVKIPYSEDGHYKAIYLYGSGYFKGKETSTVIGARITVF